ncbi:TIM23 complex component [Physocladia obscura]|uniref:Presequence translocated-associated motor subunit PAM17 n=1 Tax=Physocladia obscura TaxID=109957 RepID=A0AAD5SZI1_9FUNG|nr:TIM23 complex component [Physocladia obscura]
MRSLQTKVQSQSQKQQIQQQKLTWTQYFANKKRARRYELGVSGVSGTLSFIGGSYYFMAVKEFDPTELVFGMMDASIAYSLGAMAVGITGAVAGVFLGGAVWRGVTPKPLLKAMDSFDKQFFERVRKYRPQGQLRLSLQDPMPDYYGEKVTSVAGYREWLKKQRNYRIKTEGFKARKSIKRTVPSI